MSRLKTTSRTRYSDSSPELQHLGGLGHEEVFKVEVSLGYRESIFNKTMIQQLRTLVQLQGGRMAQQVDT